MNDRVTGLAARHRLFGPLSGEDGYHLTYAEQGVRLEARHLRRERSELVAEVAALCDWPGAKTYAGSLITADLNFSSAAARKTRAKDCLERSRCKAEDFDWIGFFEEFVVRVIDAERGGDPELTLDDAPDLGPDASFDCLGLALPWADPVMIQADGGTLKSMTALYLAGSMAKAGHPVLYFDSEWTAERHRGRKLKMFGAERLEGLTYLRAERPLSLDIGRVRKVIAARGIRYIFLDSLLPFLDGPPEDADVAQRYFRALRQLGVGTCTLAHISHSSANDPSSTPAKAFGSRFFHNLSRATWMLRKQLEHEGNTVVVGAFPDKRNDGSKGDAVGLAFTFLPDQIRVTRANLAATTELSERLPLWQRMREAVAQGAKTLTVLSTELEAKPDTIRKAAQRGKHTFTSHLSASGELSIGLVSRSFSVVGREG